MALDKMYRLRCELSSLLMDRVMHTTESTLTYGADLEVGTPERRAKQDNCKNFSVTEHSAVQARRSAKAQGWRRYSEERPVYPGSDTMTKITYDLCPGCKHHADA
jgi:hypothetical protein